MPSRESASFLLLAFCLIFPSTGIALRFLGPAGLLAYVVVAPLLLLWIRAYVASRGSPFTERQARWLAGLTLLFLIVLFAVVFPIADAGTVGGGSDADDALNIAAGELMRGEFPYYQRTYLGNAITPLPGAVMLALPFVALGESGYQNIFWLAALFLFVRRRFVSTASALLMIWTLLVLSPVILSTVVTGTDTTANSIYVALFSLMLVESVSRNDLPGWPAALSAVAFGIGLSSRANYLLLVPVILSAAIVSAGFKRAVPYVGLSVLTFVAVTVPFYLYDPGGFTPLRVQYSKVAQFEASVPFSGVAITAATAVLSFAVGIACLRRRWAPRTAILAGGATIQAFPVLCMVVLSSMRSGTLRLDWAAYGASFMVLGVLAIWPRVFGPPEQVGQAAR